MIGHHGLNLLQRDRPLARRVVRNKIKELRQKGDVEGVHAWMEVERHLSRVPASEFEKARRQTDNHD
jgi:hypothetical protein